MYVQLQRTAHGTLDAQITLESTGCQFVGAGDAPHRAMFAGTSAMFAICVVEFLALPALARVR